MIEMMWRHCAVFICAQLIVYVSGQTYEYAAHPSKDRISYGIVGLKGGLKETPSAVARNRLQDTTTTGVKDGFQETPSAVAKDRLQEIPSAVAKNHISGCPLSYEGTLLVTIYCESKLELMKHKEHFHKGKCMQRHLQTFSERCTNCFSHKRRKSKRCRAFERKLKSNSSKNSRSTRLLLNDEYFVCGFDKKSLIVYNRNNSICCSGKVLETQNLRNCCGHSLMNVSSELCCNGTKFPRKSQNEACCGTGVYDKATHFCSLGQLHLREDDRLDIMNTPVSLADHAVYLRTNAEPRKHVYDKEVPGTARASRARIGFVQKNEKMTIPSTQYESKDTLPDRMSSGETLFKGSIGLISVPVSVLAIIALMVGAVFSVLKRKANTRKKTSKNCNTTAVVSSTSPSEELNDDTYPTPTPLTNNSGPVCNSGFSSPDNGSTIVQLEQNPPSILSERIDQPIVPEVHVDANNTKSGEICRERRNSVESLYSTVTLNMSDFMKDIFKATDVNEHNFVFNLSKEASTQTCDGKESNKRDMFGKAFQFSGFLTKDNPKVQLKHSDAYMFVSVKDLLNREVEVHASSHTSLPEIRDAMGISDDQTIVSPCMEYDFPGIVKFGNHAVIVLKLAGIPGKVQVWRKRDPTLLTQDGTQCDPIVEVPIVEQHQADLDTYCLLEGDKAFVHTRVFSTYVCTKHGVDRDISLEGVLYAKMMFTPAPRASLTLVVVESLILEIEDYKKKLDNDQNKYNMQRIQDGIIAVPESVTNKDVLTVKLSIGHQDVWDFIRDPNNSDLQYDTNTLPLHDICCQKRPLGSARCLWKMETKAGTQPGDFFRCFIYIKTESQQAAKPLFTVEELIQKDPPKPVLVRAERSKSPVYSMQTGPLGPHKELNTYNSNPFN